MAAAAAALVCGSAWPRVREQLCGLAKDRARLVSPCDLARGSGACVNRIHQINVQTQGVPQRLRLTGAGLFLG